jgi:hypothetical protein
LNRSNHRQRNRWIIGGLGLILLTIVGAVGFQHWVYEPFNAYYFPNRSTNTNSKQFATDVDKIRFLKRYLTLPSAVEATEFYVVYHDNSSGIPGPSDWDIQAVLKVAPQHLSAWTQNLKANLKKQDLAWGYRLAQQRGWKLQSAPKVYAATGKIVAVFEKEGFIFQKVTTMP